MTNKEKAAKKSKALWTKAQLYGFWALIVLGLTFWAGVWFGNQAVLTSQAKENQIKAQAVEQYKAELSKEQK